MNEIKIPRSVLDEMIELKVFEFETKMQLDIVKLITPSNVRATKVQE